MKKWMIFSVLLLLLLTACQTVADNDKNPAGSTPSSSNITPPSSSSAAPPTSVPATTPPATIPTSDTGYPCIHKEYINPIWDEYDLSDCIIGYLYWLDKETHEVTLLLAEQIKDCVSEGAYVYYVKEAEPSKIYRMLIADPSQYELIHETTHGKVSGLTIYPGVENYLQFVADNKKFVVMEFDTGEETVLMEQCYINFAYIPGRDGVLDRGIWFEGKHKETDSPYEQFIYNRDTGETVHDPSL